MTNETFLAANDYLQKEHVFLIPIRNQLYEVEYELSIR